MCHPSLSVRPLVEVRELPSARLLDYSEQAYFAALCAQCPNHATNHACPPFDFSPRDYIGGFRTVYVIRAKVNTGMYLKNHDSRSGNAMETAFGIMDDAKQWLGASLMALEAEPELAGARASLPGACDLCAPAPCARQAGLPCKLGRPRYSLEALGINLARLTEDLFAEKILWTTGGRLPPWLSLISGVFADTEGVGDGIGRHLQDDGYRRQAGVSGKDAP
ncbi:putative metal-binding protein [Opitutaceae bacterium TAV1]|nr:putative metal-binding protein [Opitutaceae bacterium TAV1]